MTPDREVAAPGDVVVLDVRVHNDGNEAVLPDLALLGVDPRDVLHIDAGTELGVGERGRGTIRLRIPDDGVAGALPVVVEASERDGRAPTRTVTLALTIGAPPPVTIDASPGTVRGRRQAQLSAVVRNDGDGPLDLTAEGHADEIGMGVSPSRLRLAPGASQTLVATFVARNRAWRGDVRHGATIEVRAGGPPVTTTVTYLQKPFLPPLLLKGVAIVLLLAMWGGAAFAVVSRYQETGQLLALGGPADDATSGEGGTGAGAEGTDTSTDAGTDSAGGGTADGSGGGASGGAGGGAGAAGGGTTGDTGPEPLPVTIVGSVVGPRDLADTQVFLEEVGLGDEGTVDGSGTKVFAQAGSGSPTTAVLDVQTRPTEDDGRFAFRSDVKTSRFYRVSAVRPGFETASVVVRTGPEPDEYEVDLSLEPARGSMSGSVTSDEGDLLAGVEVLVSGGEIDYRSTTGSAEDIGRWSINGVAASPSYAVTFRSPGFASATVIRSVDAGEQLTGVDGVLVAGAGTVRGTATYRNEGIGGLDVSIAGPRGQRSTTTLTDEGVRGGFTLPALPYGTYLLTISSPDWLSLTTEVVVDRGDVVVELGDLKPATASVGGLVLQQVVAGTCDYPDPEVPEQRDDVEASPCGGVGVTLAGEGGTYRTTTATGFTGDPGTTADAFGRFRVSGITPGAYTVSLERFGYVTQNFLLELDAGGIVDLGALEPVQADLAGDRTVRATGDTAIVMELLPPLDETTGSIAATLRDASDPDTPLTPPAGTLILVDEQPQATVTLADDGQFTVDRLRSGAATLRVLAAGYDPFSIVLRVSEGATTTAGNLPLVPLATLELRVTDTLESPLGDTELFVTGTTAEATATLDATTDPDVRRCTVGLDGAGRYRENSDTSPLEGLCARTSVDGTVVLRQVAGSGDYRLITPVNEEDPAEDVTATAAELARTLPLDHEQLEQRLELSSGGTVRLQLRARRYPVITGSIVTPTATGLTAATRETFTVGAVDTIDAFPEQVTFDLNPVGIGFDLVEGGPLSAVPDGLQPRLSFGADSGLARGTYRISRVLPDEQVTPRTYELRFRNADNQLFEYRGDTALNALSFGETRAANAVLTEVPVPVRVRVFEEGTVTTDGDGVATGTPVTAAVLAADGFGAAGILGGLVVSNPVTATGVTDTDGVAVLTNGGVNQNFLVGTDLSVDVTAIGYGTRSFPDLTVPQPEADGFAEFVVQLPVEPRTVYGAVQVSPTTGTVLDDRAVLTGVAVDLLPLDGDDVVGTDVSLEVVPDIGLITYGSRATSLFQIDDVPPGDYRLRMRHGDTTQALTTISVGPDGGFTVPRETTEGTSVTIGPGGLSETVGRDTSAAPFLIDRPLALTVTLQHDFDLLGSDVLVPETGLAVAGATVTVRQADDAPHDDVDGDELARSDTTDAAGQATFTSLRGGPSHPTTIDYAAAGFVNGSTAAVTLGGVDDDATIQLTRFGQVTFDVVGSAGNSTNLKAVTDATATIDLGAAGTVTATADPAVANRYSFRSSSEVPAGTYDVTITAPGYSDPGPVSATFTNNVETTIGTVGADSPVGVVNLDQSTFVVEGLVTDSSSDEVPNVRVRVLAEGTQVGDAVLTDAFPDDDTTSYEITGVPVPTVVGDPPADDVVVYTVEFREFASPDAEVETTRPTASANITWGAIRGTQPVRVDIVLDDAAVLGGTVTGVPFAGAVDVDAGLASGLAGVEVTATCQRGCGRIESPLVTSTDANGDYEFDGASLGATEYELTFSADGYDAPAAESVTIMIVDGVPMAPPVSVTMVAQTRAVALSVVSSVTGGVIPTVLTVTATPIPDDPAGPTAVTVPLGAGGTASFTGDDALAPISWAFTTEQVDGPGLPQPHDDLTDATDVAVQRAVTAGLGTLALDGDDALRMPRWSRFTGFARVRDAVGAAAETATITLTVRDDLSVVFDPGLADPTTGGQTDADDVWTVWHPEPTDQVLLSFARTGYVTEQPAALRHAPGSVGSTTTSVPTEILLTARPRTVQLHVDTIDGTDTTGPLDGVVVEASRPDLAIAPVATSGAGDSAAGVATFTDLPPGEWTFTSTNGRGLTPPHRDVAVPLDVPVSGTTDGSDDPAVLDPGLVLEEQRLLEGTVSLRDFDGETPVLDDTVVVAEADGADVVTDDEVLAPATVDGDGVWRTYVPVGDDLTLDFSLTGYDTVTRTFLGATATPDVDVVLTATPVPATVAVVDAADGTTPIDGVTVTATGQDGEPGASGTTGETAGGAPDPGAPADLGTLAPGTYTLETSGAPAEFADAVTADGNVLTVPLLSTPETTASATIDLTAVAPAAAASTLVAPFSAATLAGDAVTYDDGIPTAAAGVVVTATRDGLEVRSEPTAADGRYELTLDAGTWSITAAVDGGPAFLVDPSFDVAADTAGPRVSTPTPGGPDLTGAVTSTAGAVEGATITAVSGQQVRSAVAAADGSYRIVGLDPGVTFAVTYAPPSPDLGVPVTRYVAPGGDPAEISLPQALPSDLGAIRVDVTGAPAGGEVTITLDEAGPFPTVSADATLTTTATADGSGAATATFEGLVPADDRSVPAGRFTVTVDAADTTTSVVTGVEVREAVTTGVDVALSPAPPATRDVVLTLTGPDGTIDDRTATLVSDGTTVPGTLSTETAPATHRFADVGTGRDWTVTVEGFATGTITVPDGPEALVLDVTLEAVSVSALLRLTDDGVALTTSDPAAALTLGDTVVVGVAPTDGEEEWAFPALREGTWTLDVPGYSPLAVAVTTGSDPFVASLTLTPAARVVELALGDGTAEPVTGASPLLTRPGEDDVAGSESTGGTYTFLSVTPGSWTLVVEGWAPVEVVVTVSDGTYTSAVTLTAA